MEASNNQQSGAVPNQDDATQLSMSPAASPTERYGPFTLASLKNPVKYTRSKAANNTPSVVPDQSILKRDADHTSPCRSADRQSPHLPEQQPVSQDSELTGGNTPNVTSVNRDDQQKTDNLKRLLKKTQVYSQVLSSLETSCAPEHLKQDIEHIENDLERQILQLEYKQSPTESRESSSWGLALRKIEITITRLAGPDETDILDALLESLEEEPVHSTPEVPEGLTRQEHARTIRENARKRAQQLAKEENAEQPRIHQRTAQKKCRKCATTEPLFIRTPCGHGFYCQLHATPYPHLPSGATRSQLCISGRGDITYPLLTARFASPYQNQCDACDPDTGTPCGKIINNIHTAYLI